MGRDDLEVSDDAVPSAVIDTTRMHDLIGASEINWRDGSGVGRPVNRPVTSAAMDFTDTPAEAAFRAEVRGWLAEHLKGDFAAIGGRGGPADEHGWETRVEWERLLGKDRWLGLSWPEEYGGRAASFAEQVVFNEEYAKANAPARVSFFGEGLFAPTLLAYGTDEQKRRFLPKIQTVEELWCQGFSEPNAGSDLANVQTRGVLDGDQWVVNGQKVWTTLAHRAQWCFCVTRTDPESTGHKGLSYLFIPMDQPGVEVRPLKQMTGTAEFNEVFFDDARTDADERPRPGRRGLEGGDGHARVRARHRVPLAAARIPARAGGAHRGRAEERRRRASRRSARSWPTRTSACRS